MRVFTFAVCCCAQGVWYDEGEDLKDTRSAFTIGDNVWAAMTPVSAGGSAPGTRLAELREATSAQPDLTRLATNHPLWFRGSTKWGDAPALSGERS